MYVTRVVIWFMGNYFIPYIEHTLDKLLGT